MQYIFSQIHCKLEKRSLRLNMSYQRLHVSAVCSCSIPNIADDTSAIILIFNNKCTD